MKIRWTFVMFLGLGTCAFSSELLAASPSKKKTFVWKWNGLRGTVSRSFQVNKNKSPKYPQTKKHSRKGTCSRSCLKRVKLPKMAFKNKGYKRIFSAVLRRPFALLRDNVGRFACGIDAVYTGQMEARDSVGRAYATTKYKNHFKDNQMSKGRVLASLRFVGSEARLRVFNLKQKKFVEFTQYKQSRGPIQTRASSVGNFGGSVHYARASCMSCLTKLSNKPQKLLLSQFVATSTPYSPATIGWRLKAKGELNRIPPNNVSFADITKLHKGARSIVETALHQFKKRGNLMLRSFRIRYRESGIVIRSKNKKPWESCHKEVLFKIEQFIDLYCPSRYGLRNVKILKEKTCCRRYGKPISQKGIGFRYMGSTNQIGFRLLGSTYRNGRSPLESKCY